MNIWKILEAASFCLAVYVLAYCFGLVCLNVWMPLIHALWYHTNFGTVSAAAVVGATAWCVYIVGFAWRRDQ